MSFKETFDLLKWKETKESIYNKTSKDVEKAIYKTHKTPEDFKALISPAADAYVEEMAQLSHKITQKRFGKTIQLYTPLYLSNECDNYCNYCGFNSNNKIKRKTLTPGEIISETNEIKKQGFEHVLLVTGESSQTVNIDYFIKAIEIIKPLFANISMEVQPLKQEEYEKLHHAGVFSVLIYQETYNKEKYAVYHPKGNKADFYYRLETPDRIGKARMHKIGLGVLLGLEDWRTDSFFCAMHLQYLQKKYWQTKCSVSFPRIRPALGASTPYITVTDRNLVQLICAYRLLNEDVELLISTREFEKFRNNIIPIGITSMSAGSKTNPGGFAVEPDSLQQFEISDTRNAQQIAKVITSHNYEPVWKDWDRTLL